MLKIGNYLIILAVKPTPSQRATVKYFFVVAALWVVQVGLGALTAHYGVEGSGFYGIPLDRWLPYSVTRTWHLQIGLFWIATSWLATGLYVAPAVSGVEPKGQRLGVNVLFGALLFVVLGSLAGEWMSIEHKLGNLWFWFGTQGYEYVDLGRFWQILLFGGLSFWLWLMWRALKPALKKKDGDYSLLLMFLLSSVAIPLFYAAGLMYGERSNLVTAEYWRWWVVHLWVEGFFEVFATVVIAFLLTRLKLLSVPTATRAVMFSTAVFLSGGIIGTFHHLYFAGTPNIVLGLGAVFSALEVVPLVLIGFEAWETAVENGEIRAFAAEGRRVRGRLLDLHPRRARGRLRRLQHDRHQGGQRSACVLLAGGSPGQEGGGPATSHVAGEDSTGHGQRRWHPGRSRARVPIRHTTRDLGASPCARGALRRPSLFPPSLR